MPYRIKSPITKDRIGRRGACLMAFGLVQFVVGLGLLTQPEGRDGAIRTVPVFLRFADTPFWGWSWFLFGLLVFLSAMFRDQAQRIGYVFAYILPFVYGTGYGLSWLFNEAVTGWITCLIYYGFALLVLTISGWPEHPTDKYPAYLPKPRE